MELTIAFVATALPTLVFILFSRAATAKRKRVERKRKGNGHPSKAHLPASETAASSDEPVLGPADISQRAKKNIAWFLGKHKRQISRIEAAQSRIDLMTAENWLMRHVLTDIYQAHLQNGLASETLSYAGGLGGDLKLLTAASRFFNRLFRARTPVKPEHIVVGAGCSAILDSLLYDICEQGDGVLIEVPFWGT
jgi:DNA-binding transcriptional MocR family regulator